ncbi:MAG: hypothetical protein AUH91_04345 [Verrucomicrobia bacterium 13_1_40CM_4_54_4]|nr:MAG: hypothetical protein AUH91_04345 [Verrucomicrobia bacterium 13_1_40CM_4_54_4]
MLPGGVEFFLYHQRFNLGAEPVQLRLGRADLLDHWRQLSAHKVTALRRQRFPFARPGPARPQRLVLMLDAQHPTVILQPAHLPLPELTLSPQLPALLLGSARNANRS